MNKIKPFGAFSFAQILDNYILWVYNVLRELTTIKVNMRRSDDENYWRYTWADLADDDNTIHRPVEEAVFALIYLEGHPVDRRNYNRIESVGETPSRDSEAVCSVPSLLAANPIRRRSRKKKYTERRKQVGDGFTDKVG